MSGFFPIAVAAERANYSYSYVQQLAKTQRIETREFYGKYLVNLSQLLELKIKMSALGPAKYTPRRYRKAMRGSSTEELGQEHS